jgi:hypothetical protein
VLKKSGKKKKKKKAANPTHQEEQSGGAGNKEKETGGMGWRRTLGVVLRGLREMRGFGSYHTDQVAYAPHGLGPGNACTFCRRIVLFSRPMIPSCIPASSFSLFPTVDARVYDTSSYDKSIDCHRAELSG